MVVVADASKAVECLGAFPLPVEVVPFAVPLVRRLLQAKGVTPRLRTRGDGEPFVTDEGNRILDCAFERIEDPEAWAGALGAMPGVVEHGLFLGLASEVLLAREERVERLVAAP